MTAPDSLDPVVDFVADGDLLLMPARERARLLLIDALVLACAADTAPGGADLVELGAGTGPHRCWFSNARLGPADAVQANAAATCARFQEDTDMGSWSHPGSFVVPAAVAAAVEAGTSLGRLIDGLIVGYAVTSWLGGAGAVAAAMMTRGHRPSPTFAPAGAGAAAARVLGLNRAQARHALAAALLLGRGSLHSVGSGGEDWRLHNPGAARDGFLAALAAARGMGTGGDALSGPLGFLSVFAGMDHAPSSYAKPPTAELVLDVWHKALPTLGDNMAVAVVARELHARLDGGIPDRVEVTMNGEFARFPGTQTRPPYPSLTSALASVRFVTAQLLLTGRLDFADYARRDDPVVTALADRIEVRPDDALDFTDAVVTIETAGTRTTLAARELPATLFHRDAAEQRRVAGEILGARGVALVDAVLDADESDPAAAVIDGALDRFHSAHPTIPSMR
ncbi:MmgE/PrpD family protein [Planosporangium mesophilum]|uniref:MmgE/PrpD family protein n=1 Tax=Planosporangium mesophilum TaxID=689768 RepID=UPI001439BF91|nr:MmgE/PrpD family protein [Planosporangium mesophilum]NJC82952.1 MmgE/PrpD family protein [Planosporangium mesophilum]